MSLMIKGMDLPKATKRVIVELYDENGLLIKSRDSEEDNIEVTEISDYKLNAALEVLDNLMSKLDRAVLYGGEADEPNTKGD